MLEPPWSRAVRHFAEHAMSNRVRAVFVFDIEIGFLAFGSLVVQGGVEFEERLEVGAKRYGMVDAARYLWPLQRHAGDVDPRSLR
jgi:hypothetical protein